MKKILALAIGLGMVLGTVSIAFGQGDTTDTTKKMSKKKKKKSGTDTEKK